MENQTELYKATEAQHLIVSIRAMNPCKARTEAVLQLQKQAENWITENAHLGIYIKGNVPSSKNSKEIGMYKKYVPDPDNPMNTKGILKEFHTLQDSATTKEYRLVSRPQWIDNKRKFKSLSEGLKMPLNVEFTFIRDSMRRFDYHNAVQVCADVMVECGYITDDETCYLKPVFGEVFYSKSLAGVVMKVLK
ncbi:hypothetical protein [Mucilaginibacter xinganensis]|uniref:Crossover junction endodeoxyribonuclease RusA n=1 Tax=Mucilaginibacter xinganensis TaxID=1234841 RepID=A0A223NXE1_9SPHI|nr:hypothetical protein [Mucilaginibacter xinganensis]ASU34364.1 crossover junction endodeoxyribonuclease RusA [Mucilaginibacter xinganensis]